MQKIWGNKKYKWRMRLNKDCFEERIKFDLISKIQIRIRNKEQILKDLDKLGINSATLFPEIDNVASYLKSL